MAYNAFPQPTQTMIPAPPQAGVFPLRPDTIAQGAAERPQRRAGVSEPAVVDTSGLLRFLILLAIISGLTCLYVWQANTISAIRDDTRVLSQEIRTLERQNVGLMLQYARWDAPDYIEVASSESGMVAGQAPVRVRLRGLGEHQDATQPEAEYGFPIRELAASLPGSLTLGSQPR
jgi:hypothetical protein